MHDNRPPRGPRQAGGAGESSNYQSMAPSQGMASPSRQHSEGILPFLISFPLGFFPTRSLVVTPSSALSYIGLHDV